MNHKARKTAKWIELAIVVWTIVFVLSLTVMAATTTNTSNGLQLSVSSGGNVTVSKGEDATSTTWTIVAEGTDGACSTTNTETVTFTIKNTDTTRAVEFVISVSSTGDTGTTPSGTQTLSANTELSSFTATSGEGASASETITITITGIKWESLGTTVTTTVKPAAGGTIKVDDTEVTTRTEYKKLDSETYALTAIPDDGYEFYGWMSATGPITTDGATSYTYQGQSTATLWPLFIKTGSAVYYIKDASPRLYYAYLDEAIAAAGDSGTVVVGKDGTAYHSDSRKNSFTIPSGVTLLIPYDDANTLCTTEPTCDADSYEKPSVYRTLTMANGANITVNGAISLSAAQSSKIRYNAMPSGPLPFIKMDSGSNITVKKGGALYAWGYITGSGSVSVESGGTVYECFQIGDYRGGDVTSTMTSNADYGVFPFTQYYLQNIEVPMTLYAGAIEKGYTSVQVTAVGDQHSDIPFIGTSDSMFVIDSGYVVKDYVEGTGRTNIEIHGDISVSTISMSIKVSIFGTVDIDSSKYSLPIPNHFTVSVESGKINLAQSMVFLPGSELTIKRGASCTLGSGKTIYVYDLDEWYQEDSTTKGYTGYNEVYSKLKYVPGGDGTTGRLKDAQIQIDGTVDASAGSVYVTAGGANIFSTGTGVVKVGYTTDTTARQVITNGSKISSWPEIAMQPAILQDEDGIDVATEEKAGTYTYYASTGKWCPPGHRYKSVVTDPTCTTAGYTTHTCIACGYSYQDSNIDALGHTWGEDGTCTVCGLIQIAGTSVTAGDSLDIYFYVDATLVSDGCKAVITRTRMVKDPSGAYSEESTERVEIPYDEWTKSGSYLRFCYKGIAAKEMTDPVSVTIYDASGKQISTTVTESIEGYALRSLEKHSDANLHAALVDMLYYGAAAQNYFGYKTTDLATDGLTDVQKAYATKSVAYTNITTATNTTYTLAGANVIAESNLYFTFYFDGITDVTNMSAVITYTDHYGDAHTQNIAGSDFSSNSGYYGPRVTGIAVADGNTPITCRLMKDGEIVETVTSSVTSYAVATVDNNKETDPVLTELCNDLMKFIYSAHTYFHAG